LSWSKILIFRAKNDYSTKTENRSQYYNERQETSISETIMSARIIHALIWRRIPAVAGKTG